MGIHLPNEMGSQRATRSFPTDSISKMVVLKYVVSYCKCNNISCPH